METDPPRAFPKRNHTELTALAKQKLPQIEGQPCVNQALPQLERSHILHTESDVVRASMLYLIHPVNVAASKLLGNNNKTLYCRSEILSGSSRTDIRWQVTDGHTYRNVAVLEFKNTKVLHWQDFRKASPQGVSAKDMRNTALGRKDQTLFESNALVVSKQAKKYSEEIAPDVAVFDWEHMFIFDFTDVREDASDPKLCRGIWFEESAQHQNDKETFRMVLLGFLIRALRRYNYLT